MLSFRRKMVPIPRWDKGGVSAFTASGTTIAIGWQEVTAIYCYKKDLLTYDDIRLIIASKDWQVEFSEDDSTFSRLRDYIGEVFAISPDWHRVLICSQAFETTWTVLYSTEPDSGSKETR